MIAEDNRGRVGPELCIILLLFLKCLEAREQLVQLVGDPDEATRLVVEQMNKSADKGEK